MENYKTLEEFEKKNEHLTLQELETNARSFLLKSREAQEVFYFHLFLIERARKFRDNPTYKNSGFFVYLLAEFQIREKTYQNARKAFKAFPFDARKHGHGIIASIINKCGDTKVATVLKEINKAQEKRKTPLKFEDKQKIIDKHLKPPKKVDKVDYKQRCFLLEKENMTLKERERALIKEIQQITDQNSKLKTRVKELESNKISIPTDDLGSKIYNLVQEYREGAMHQQ